MTASQPISLSVIIVNYRSAELIVDCLRSVYRYNQLPMEIIVVDNDPAGKGQDLVKKEFPEVNWIEMGYNAGFARANNKGMKAAQGDCFLLLNPDTLATDDSITRCYHQLRASGFLAAGVQQVNADGSFQISGNFFVKGGLNHLLPLPYWGGFIRWLGYRTKTRVPNVKEASAIEKVDWISGAFLMVKKVAVQQAGFMDEDFFLYAEEVEWCSRLRKLGELCIFGDLRIIHLEGATINREQKSEQKGYYNLFDKKGLQLMVSNHLRVRKQYGVFWFLFLLLNYTWAVVFFWVAGTVHRLFTLRNPFGHWGDVIDFGDNVTILWSLAYRIIRNRPHFYKMF